MPITVEVAELDDGRLFVVPQEDDPEDGVTQEVAREWLPHTYRMGDGRLFVAIAMPWDVTEDG